MKLIKQDKPPLRVQRSDTSTARVKSDTFISDKYTRLEGIDVTCLGTGHLSCPKCAHNFFDLDIDPVKLKVLIGCHKCGHEQKLLFPTSVFFDVPPGNQHCRRGHNGGFAIIKSDETLCIGCRHCDVEIRVKVYNDERKIFIA